MCFLPILSDNGRCTLSDLPFDVIVEQVDKLLTESPTAEVYQKFTCERCGARQTMDKPNSFYREGSCEECGHVSPIHYCGFAMVILGHGEES